jgi:hypothetical protein
MTMGRSISYILRLLLILTISASISACNTETNSALPQATIPLPQGDDTDGVIISAPDESGMVAVKGGSDTVPDDSFVVLQVYSEEELFEEVEAEMYGDGGDNQGNNGNKCKKKQNLPVCPEVNANLKCQATSESSGSFDTEVPAAVDSYIVVSYVENASCEETDLVEVKVQEVPINVEVEQDKSTEENASENGLEYSATADEPGVEEEAEADGTYLVGEADIGNSNEGMDAGNGADVDEGNSGNNGNVVGVQPGIPVAGSEPSVEEDPKDIPAKVYKLPKMGRRRFAKRVLPNGIFIPAKEINKRRIRRVPFLKVMGDEIIMVVGVKVRRQKSLAYFIVSIDIDYNGDKPVFTFGDYNFITNGNRHTRVRLRNKYNKHVGKRVKYLKVFSKAAKFVYWVDLDTFGWHNTPPWR